MAALGFGGLKSSVRHAGGGLFFPVSSKPLVAMDLSDLDDMDAFGALVLPSAAPQLKRSLSRTLSTSSKVSALKKPKPYSRESSGP